MIPLRPLLALGWLTLGLGLGLLPSPARSVDSPLRPGGTYCQGWLAQELYRYGHATGQWNWPLTANPDQATIRIGLEDPEATWGADFHLVLQAVTSGGSPPPWIQVTGPDATSPEASILPFEDPQEGIPGLESSQDALFGLLYGRLSRIQLPDAALVRASRSDARLRKQLSHSLLPPRSFGIWIRRGGPSSFPQELIHHFENMGTNPHGAKVLYELGASWLRPPKAGSP